ncbi:MAG: isopenicillin N synthase family oxygenase [Cyanobacteria bacterium Co-bin13]|nr:isopenicillin N synthase family oxygenase [Cyanobacteria bacterium Co-bin13]
MKTAVCIPQLPDPAVQRAEFAQQLSAALSRVGAAYVPVSQRISDGQSLALGSDRNLLQTLQSFFNLSELQKRSLAQQLTSPWQGVFIALGQEQLADDQQDHKEVLDLNLENGTYARWIRRWQARRLAEAGLSADPPLVGQLAKEEPLGQVAASLYQIFEAFQEQANHILAALETVYGQPAGSLVNQHGKNSTLRLLHYPPAPHFTVGSIRLGAHQDYSGITLLWQDSTGGLEILTPDREWVAVEVPPGCIGVIAGEVTQRWSGNTLHSAPHRVRVANSQQLAKTRYSIAFFCETNPDCVVQPGALLGQPQAEAQPIAVEAFLSQKYDQIFAKSDF